MKVLKRGCYPGHIPWPHQAGHIPQSKIGKAIAYALNQWTELCRFVVAPTVNLQVIEMCRRYAKPIMPGAMTPTEALTAWEAGADVIKLFPFCLPR